MKAQPPTMPKGPGPTKGLPPVSEKMMPAWAMALMVEWPTAAARQLPVRSVTYVRKIPQTTQNTHMAAMPANGQPG